MKPSLYIQCALRSDLCVFCTAQLRRRSEAIPYRALQRRLLHQSKPTAKVGASSAVFKEDEREKEFAYGDVLQGDWGGLGSSHVRRSSATPEWARPLNNIKKPDGGFKRLHEANNLRADRQEALDRSRPSQMPNRHSAYGESRSNEGGQQNNIRIRKTSTYDSGSKFVPSPSIDQNTGVQWQHLRKRTPNEKNESWSPIRFQREDNGGINRLERLAQESRLREAQATGGRFVPLQQYTTGQRRLCSRCGDTNHTISQCPLPARSRTSSESLTPRRAAFETRGPTMQESPPFSIRRVISDIPDHSFDIEERPPMNRAQDSRVKAERRITSRSTRFDERERRDRRADRNLLYKREAAMNQVEEKERAERRRQKELRRQQQQQQQQSASDTMPQLQIPGFINMGQLATLLNVRWDRFERKIQRLGFEKMNQSHVIAAENAGLIAMEYGFEPIIETVDEDLRAAPEPEDKSNLPQRPPVVTIMGHVDHGKTTILDYLRKSSVAATEHGGITQHIGAFSVPLRSGRAITFLDTPGHAAFLDMRHRGAIVTDIVVLVVAADDSVMPQTIEAINHANSARVPIIVAINKMDKEDAHPERVKQDLARYGIEVEDFGGDTQAIHVSGKTGLGMDDLEEAIATLSEIQDHRADPESGVEGWVLEGSKKRTGKSATVLVRKGTLRRGNIIVAGNTWARVRTMKNEAGIQIDEVGPGMPALIEGWKDQPIAGDEVLQAPTEQKATDVVAYRKARADQVKMAADLDAMNNARRLEQEKREKGLAAAETAAPASLGKETGTSDAQISPKGPQDVNFIVKGDVSGSVEAVLNTIASIGNSEIQPKILQSGVGAVSHGDVEYAAVTDGTIVAFNTSKEFGVERAAEDKGVRLLEQNIIYRLENDVKAIMSERLPLVIKQKVTGEAEISQVFNINVRGRMYKKIAGSKVLNGSMKLNSKARVVRGRGKTVIYEGKVSSLKQVKKDVTEMGKGTECGIGFQSWEEFEAGDQIQCYDEWSEKRSL